MRITTINARCLSVPIKFLFTETPRREGMLLVEVGTDEGLIGHGISRDSERFAVRELTFLTGRSPLETEKIWMDASWETGSLGVFQPSRRRERSTSLRGTDGMGVALPRIKFLRGFKRKAKQFTVRHQQPIEVI